MAVIIALLHANVTFYMHKSVPYISNRCYNCGHFLPSADLVASNLNSTFLMEFCRNMQFSQRGCSYSLPNITYTELWEMVSVLVCILPSSVSVESMSWRQFLPLPPSLLVHYLTHPLARLTLVILFIALSGFSSAGPIRSISAPFEERITNISPLQPQTPHVQWHQWIPLMCQDEYVCKCVFF